MSGLIPITKECPSVISHINERLGVMRTNNPNLLPDLSQTQSVFSVSDYAGENKEGYFQVLSFAVVDWNATVCWDLARKALRYTKLDFERTMEFKKLNQDRELQRILTEFLNTFDHIPYISNSQRYSLFVLH